jgi:hypothetical protein
MDSVDDFEIKPLTDGLGFHKKASSLSEHVKRSGIIESQSAQVPGFAPGELLSKPFQSAPPPPQAFADLLRALEKPQGPRTEPRPAPSPEVRIFQPLPSPSNERPSQPELKIPRPATPDFPALSRRPQATPLAQVVENVGLKRGAADSPMRMLESATVSIPSALLDGIIIMALTLVFLMALMTITKVDIISLFVQQGISGAVKLALASLTAAIWMMYVVVARSFFGSTIGEWTFDLQIGDDRQQRQAVYPLKVFWRSVLVLATGIVVLPIFSMAVGRDLLAPLTGLQLYRRQ